MRRPEVIDDLLSCRTIEANVIDDPIEPIRGIAFGEAILELAPET